MQHVNEMRGSGPPLSGDQIKQCFQNTFNVIQQLKVEAGIGDEASTFNIMVTDGYRIFGTRFSSNPEKETRSLYYSTGSRFQCKDGKSRMVQDDSGTKAVLIVSEKLNNIEEEWTPIPQNHFVSVNRNLGVHLSPLDHATSFTKSHG